MVDIAKRNARQTRLAVNKLKKGEKRVTMWLPGEVLDALRQTHPTALGAVDWPKVAQAAMDGPVLPVDTLAELQAVFGHQGGRIDWGKVSGDALQWAKQRVRHAERQRANHVATRAANGVSANAMRCRAHREKKAKSPPTTD